MKKILFLFLMPFLLSAQSEITSSETDWLTDYASALDIAQKERKNILVYFTGSDWCPPCKMLKKDFFDTEEFNTLAIDYVLLYVDMPRSKSLISSDQLLHNQKLLVKWNKKGVFPLIAILDNKETMLDEISGYGMDGNTKRHRKLLEKFSKR